MTLPRPLFLRLRRKLRRLLSKPMTSEPATLRAIEEWTGHRSPPSTQRDMKILAYIIAFLAGVAAAVLLTGCVETTVTDRYTDAKGHVVERETKTKTTDPAAWALANTVATAYAPPRGLIVREQKSGPAMRKHLICWRGRQEIACHVLIDDGPIRKEEVQRRYRQLPPP